MKNSSYPQVWEHRVGKRLVYLTKNLTPGLAVYGERLHKNGQNELREWDPRRSKVGAAMHNGLKKMPIEKGSYVLYLGCASGTTVSHISDIVGRGGLVFAVDIGSRVLRDLIFLARERKNIAPILMDANKVDELAKHITSVDVLIQDVAQKHQVAIFLKNMKFLEKGGVAMLAVKARSIDVAKAPKAIFAQVKKELEKECKILQSISLEPHEKDHMMFVCTAK